jgi:hypothetical protein
VDDLVVVDDDSYPSEQIKIASLAAAHNARYLALPRPEVPAERFGRRSHARNAATRATVADVMLYVDGDMLLGPRYIDEARRYHGFDPLALVHGERFSIPLEEQVLGLSSCLERARTGHGVGVSQDVRYKTGVALERHVDVGILPLIGSAVLCRRSLTRREWLQVAAGSVGAGLMPRDADVLPYSNRWDWCASNNLSVRRRHVIENGLWDERFLGWGEEDMDFSYRMFSAGLRPVLPLGTPLRAYHLDHPVDVERNRATLRSNAAYLLQKWPHLRACRLPAYANYGLTADDLLEVSADGLVS